MEIIVEATEQDHKDFYREYGLKRNLLQRVLILIVIDFLLSYFEPLSLNYLVNLLVIGIVLFTVLSLSSYFLAKARFKNEYDNLLFPHVQKTYKPFATGIEVTEDAETVFLKYAEVKQTGKAGNFIFLILLDGSYYLLPIWCFSSLHEARHFLRLVTNGVANAKGIRPKEPFTFKPGYLFAILCLIPIIGFVTGIILIILGIVHYKDRIFIIIGSIGVLVTVAIYGSMIYYTENNSFTSDGFTDITKIQLNELVKNIEFYKLQNGAYPDSLKQIETKDSFVSTTDPLQTFKQKKDVMYQYHKDRNRYLLFSVGKDGKPNTKDDIYPTLTNPDSSKLGFIRK